LILLPKENLAPVAKIESVHYEPDGTKTEKAYVSHYEDGRLIRSQRLERGEPALDEIYIYEKRRRKEKITRKSTNPKRNTITINYFDKQQRLKRVESYMPGEDKPGSIQSKFKYNEADQLESCQVTSVFGNGRHSIGYVRFHYPDAYTQKRETIEGEMGKKTFEIIIEYDTLFRTATTTTVSYEYLPRPGDPPRRRSIYGSDRAGERAWMERDTLMLNGEARAVNKRIMQSKCVYDDRGNPIEWYSLLQDGAKRLSSRSTIEYRD